MFDEYYSVLSECDKLSPSYGAISEYDKTATTVVAVNYQQHNIGIHMWTVNWCRTECVCWWGRLWWWPLFKAAAPTQSINNVCLINIHRWIDKQHNHFVLLIYFNLSFNAIISTIRYHLASSFGEHTHWWLCLCEPTLHLFGLGRRHSISRYLSMAEKTKSYSLLWREFSD